MTQPLQCALLGALFSFAVLTAPDAIAAPPEVEREFQKLYEAVSDPEWEIDQHGNWEASFDEGGKKKRADFTPQGLWIETEQNLSFDDLPAAVRTAVRDEFGDAEISEIEKVSSAEKGDFFDVEFKAEGKNRDVEYDIGGKRLSAEPATVLGAIATTAQGFTNPLGELEKAGTVPFEITVPELLLEFAINLVAIFLFAYVIYYRRHHDHRMFFLLLGFNLFLFPIFLLNSVLTAGFGFTIFALLALVRLRSENFNKAEVAYLLGAVSLTFINATLPAGAEYVASAMVLLTAYVGDHPSLWRAAYQQVEIRHPISSRKKVLDLDHLRSEVAEQYDVEVDNVEIDRIDKKVARLTVMYRKMGEATVQEGKKKSKNDE